jgi:sulfur carrier protein ThiS adenylyltransferase
MDYAQYARNLPGIQDKLKCGRVGIAGAGGLGSNIAVMLARVGVGKLLIADFDKVEESNLNRQCYNHSHIGMYKAEALKAQLTQINPHIQTETLTCKITADNAAEVFADCGIVCEAFDRAEFKADIVNALLQTGKHRVIAASGMCGVDDTNKIVTVRKMSNLYVCGDGVPSEHGVEGFMAPRVSVCAGHQANMAVRLLLGLEDI